MNAELLELLKETPSGKFKKYSITRANMLTLLHVLLGIAKKERGFQKDDITSNDLQALFQGKSWVNGAWAEMGDINALQFHPIEKFPELYSDKMPDRIISYPWKGFGLLTDLQLFLYGCERLKPAESDATLWLDILYNLQVQSSHAPTQHACLLTESVN